MTAVDLPRAGADLRAELRVVSAASGLLMLLDQHRLTGRMPVDVRVQVARLRNAVKVVVRGPALPLPAPGPRGWVYLLCFRDPATGEHRPYRGKGHGGQYAGHYWGWTTDLVRRVEHEHRNPNWHGRGRLVRVALAAGLWPALAWAEYPATPGRERRLKDQGSAYRRCRLCRGTGGPLDPAAVVAAVAAAQHGGRP